MCYQIGQIYLILLRERSSSQFLVRIVEEQGQLYLLPLNIPDQQPLPIAVLKDYQPLLMGDKPKDHQYLEGFIAKHCATLNVVLWNNLQCRYGKRTLGKLFLSVCEN